MDRLIRALPAIRASLPDVRLIVAGEGAEEPKLRRLVDDLEIAEAVTFLGGVLSDQVPELIASARLVVLPSRHEGLPYVALEAAERGRAVVGTDIAGMNEVVEQEVTGLVVPQLDLDDDPTPLATAIVRVLSEPGLAERLGAAARHRIEERFSVQACAATYDLLYRRLTTLSPPPRVSVLIPAWNAERYVEAAVSSVLSQSMGDLEVIVVLDGCTDGTAARLATIQDPRLIVLHQPHRGIGASRNAGLALSRADVIGHLDADDRWPLDRLEQLLARLDADPSLDAVFGCGIEFAAENIPTNATVTLTPQPVRLLTTGLIRRAAQFRYPPFSSIPYGDHVEWIGRALNSGLNYTIIDHIVLERRVHAHNHSHRHPFLKEKGRLFMLKSLLDERRR